MEEVPSSFPRDVVWSIVQWLPWREQLRVRRVCRAWRNVVHERVTAAPPVVPEAALPALLHCHLHALILRDLASDVVLALPPTLRDVRIRGDAQLALLGTLPPLEVLEVPECNEDTVAALCSLPTLTMLETLNATMDDASAIRVARALTRLRRVTVAEFSSPLLRALLQHGPSTLTHVRSTEGGAQASQLALQQTPLQLETLIIPCDMPLPLERWTRLKSLRIVSVEDGSAMNDLVHAMVRAQSVRSFSFCYWVEEESSPLELSALTMLEYLCMRVWADNDNVNSHLAGQLMHLTRLTTLQVGVVFGAGQVRALEALRLLRTLELIRCSGPGMMELDALIQVRELTLLVCHDVDLAHLPGRLERLELQLVKQLDQFKRAQLVHLGQLVTLRHLELTGCAMCAEVLPSWALLVRLESLRLSFEYQLAPTFLQDVECAFPALRSVVLCDCVPVTPLPSRSRVRVTIEE